MSAVANNLGDRVVIFGGTGFIGRELVAGWTGPRLRVLLHQSRPDWIEATGVETRPVDLEDAALLDAALADCTCAVNLMRPRGDGALSSQLSRLADRIARSPVKRFIHASSVDVYNGVTDRLVTEDTPTAPLTRYDREHLDIEAIITKLPIDTCILRLGAVFGEGGRNIVQFVSEAKNAPIWKLAARRSLYGNRRMHLVSAEKVAQAISFLVSYDRPLGGCRILVTDDAAEENNFAYLQDRLLETMSRRSLAWVPRLPRQALQLALRIRGQSALIPIRRFSDRQLRTMGFTHDAFKESLDRYLDSFREIN